MDRVEDTQKSPPSAFWKYRGCFSVMFQRLLFILSQVSELPVNTYDENIISICWYWLRRDLSWIGFAFQSNRTPEHKVNRCQRDKSDGGVSHSWIPAVSLFNGQISMNAQGNAALNIYMLHKYFLLTYYVRVILRNGCYFHLAIFKFPFILFNIFLFIQTREPFLHNPITDTSFTPYE